MIAWSVGAVGGVYAWAAAPLVVAAIVLATGARALPARSGETRTLDWLLVAAVVAVACQLVPLPALVRAPLSPGADAIRSAIYLGPAEARWRPLSVSPFSTAYALALVVTALMVFWAARRSCGLGMTRRIVRVVAFTGLLGALVAIGHQATGDPTLIYGRWRPLDAGARPFGPFVNRNHFATWVVMACPLAAGYVASVLAGRHPTSGTAARLARLIAGIGTSTLWVAVAGVVMTLALTLSTSRSGLVAFGAALTAGAWFARGRLTRKAAVLNLAAVGTLAVIVAALTRWQPLLSRVEETLAVGAGGRQEIWRQTLPLIRDFWPTGTGLGSYQTAMLVYQHTDRAVFINQAHNQYLQLLAEGGAPLTAVVVAALVAFIRLFRARLAEDKTASAWLRIGAAIALTAAGVQGIWETGLRIPANGLLFAIAAAVAVHRPAPDPNDLRPVPAVREAR